MGYLERFAVGRVIYTGLHLQSSPFARASSMDIIVNEELKAYIDPLTPEEHAALERSILTEGCRDALVLWGDVLVDGHNRYGICQKHGLPFNTVQSTLVQVHRRRASVDDRSASGPPQRLGLSAWCPGSAQTRNSCCAPTARHRRCCLSAESLRRQTTQKARSSRPPSQTPRPITRLQEPGRPCQSGTPEQQPSGDDRKDPEASGSRSWWPQ